MRPPRITEAGATYHVTVQCHNHDFKFVNDADFQILLDTIKKGKEKYHTLIFGYNFCHNHYHLIVKTPEEDNLSKFMQYVNGNSARTLNKCHGKSGAFWNSRFASTIIDEDEYLFNATNYVELNMVRCKAVENPQDWKWSSYNHHALGKEDPILDPHPLLDELAPTKEECQQQYQEITENNMQEKGLKSNPELTTGLILGSETFVTRILNKVQQITYYAKRQIHKTENGCFIYQSRPKTNKRQ